jgi:tetratricopeptide (TPR) repeat protein
MKHIRGRKPLFYGCSLIIVALLAINLHAQSAPLNAPQANLYALTYQANQTQWQSDSLLAIGDIWRDMGSLPRAIPYWQIVNAQQPSLDLFRRIAEYQLQSERYGEATETLEQAIELYPSDVWLNAYLGFLLAPTQPERARPYLNYILFNDIYGDTAKDLFSLIVEGLPEPLHSSQAGSILASGQYFELAEWAFRFSAAWNYPFPDAMAQVGFMRDLQGKDGAWWLSEAVTLDPNNADVQFTYGLHLRNAQDYQNAITAFQTAIALEPSNPVYYVELAITYELIGNDTLARQYRFTAERLVAAQNTP